MDDGWVLVVNRFQLPSLPAQTCERLPERVDDASSVGKSESGDLHWGNICCRLCRRRGTRHRLVYLRDLAWGKLLDDVIVQAARPGQYCRASGHALSATPRFRVAGCETHPIDNLFQRMERDSRWGDPGKAELGLGIRRRFLAALAGCDGRSQCNLWTSIRTENERIVEGLFSTIRRVQSRCGLMQLMFLSFLRAREPRCLGV